MEKVNQDPFSNGEEHRWWSARNCDKCIKQSHYSERFEKFIVRCAVCRDIEIRMISDEPIAQRTIDICRKNDCPFRKEHWPKRKRKSKTANLPSLFEE